jgi:hypothetical protein
MRALGLRDRLGVGSRCFLAALGRGRAGVIALAIATLLIVGCPGQEPPTAGSESDCLALRDHVASVSLRGRETAGLSEAELAKHRRALSKSLGSQYVKDCQRQMTPVALECALAATSRDELRSCQTTFGVASLQGESR